MSIFIARCVFFVVCLTLLTHGFAFAEPMVSFMGKLEGASSFVGDGTFTGSSAYIQLWLDRNDDGLASPVPGKTLVGDDQLIREVAIAGKSGVFGTKVLDSTDKFVAGVYWIRAIASADGTPGISSENGSDGSDSGKIQGDTGFGFAPSIPAIYGDANVTLDGSSVTPVTDTEKALEFFVLDFGLTENPGTILLDTPYPTLQ